MADYSYLFADLRTDAVLAELPLVDGSFGRRLSGAGTWSAKVPLGDPLVARLDPVAATIPGRTSLYVQRDGVTVAGGILWTRRYSIDDDGHGFLELDGNEHWSYFARRRIRTTTVFEEVDQGVIASTLLAAAQAAAGGDIGVTVPIPATGVLRDRTYYGYELKPVAEAIEQLSEVLDGFEFRIHLSHPGPKILELGSPRLGIEAFATDLLFELPGNLLKYVYPEDATKQANDTTAVGEGEGDDMLLASATRADLIAAGWPLLEESVSYKDIRDIEYLQAHADADVERTPLPVTIPAFTVLGDVDPIVGTYDVGDDARVRILDDRFPAALDAFVRIVGLEIHPQDDEGRETVTLEVGEVAA